MSENTEFRRKSNPAKTLGAWIAIVVAVGGLAAGVAKAYFVTPLVLDRHSEEIKSLQQADADTTRELRAQRDLLLEIRGDLKALSRNQNRNNQS